MKKELNLISEISRVREMMGFGDVNYTTKKYINETINGNNKFLLTEAAGPKEDWAIMLYKAITGDDNYATLFGKSVADQWDAGARNLAEVLEREGLDDIGKLMNNIGIAKGIDPSRVTNEMVDDALKLYFKTNPDVAEKILKNSATFIQDTLKGRDFLSILGAGNRVLADDLAYIFGIQINPAEAAILKPQLDAISQQFRNSGLNLNDPAIKEILDGFENLAKTSDAMDGTAGKIPDASPEAAPIPKDVMAGGKTKAEIEADARAKADADAEAKANADREESQRQSDANFEKLKNEALEDAIDKLKADPNFSKAWSMWQKLFSLLGMGAKANYISRAEKILGKKQLSTFTDYINTPEFASLEKELLDRAKKRQGGKGGTKANIDAATGIMVSLRKFFFSGPGGKALFVLSSLATVAIVLYCIDYAWDLGDIWRNMRDWAWDSTPGTALFGDPNIDIEFCLRQINGYYDIPEDDRFKLLSVPITCDNIKQENFQTFISNIVYLKGGTAMDGSGNTVTKKDRFKITIGGKDVELEVGGKTPVVSPTPPTPTPPTPTSTPVPGVYTNTQADFIKWVGVAHPGKYGTDYEWEGTAGYYYPGGGDSGNAMTFDPSGWK